MQNVTKIQKEYAKWTIQKQFGYWTIVAKILVLTFTITCFKFSCKWQNGNICPWLIDDQLRPPPTHTHLMALCLGLPGWASTRKVKPIWISLKLQTVSGSGISWAVFQSASRSRQITMPAHHNSVFLQSGCSSCRPTNSVKAPINNTDIQHKTKNDMHMEYLHLSSMWRRLISSCWLRSSSSFCRRLNTGRTSTCRLGSTFFCKSQ